MADKSAYGNGQRARRQGRVLTDNPYTFETTAQSENNLTWAKGWRDEDAIINALSPESGWKPGGKHV